MFTLSLRAHREKPALVVDVENGSIGVGIVLKRGNSPAEILASNRVYLASEERSNEHHTSTILRHLRETLASSLNSYVEGPLARQHGAIESLHVVVGTPWVRSRSIVSEEDYGKETVISETTIKRLAKNALSQPSEFMLNDIFESSVTRVQLNGYPTAKPIGKKAHHISVTVFQSEMSSYLKRGIEAAVHDLLPGRILDFRSATRVALTTLHEFSKNNHYLYIAVGSTSTECVSVHKEDANEHISLPIGTSLIVQKIAGEKGLPESVFSLLRMLASDTCTTTECGSLLTNLAKLEPELVKMFGDAFASVAAHRKIPNACFLAVHPDVAPWFEHFFSRIDFAQFTVTARPLTVSLLTPDHLQRHVLYSRAFSDTNLSLAAAFVNTLDA